MTTFRTSREIPAPASAVFAAFEDPDRLARWWGPDGFTSTFHRFEFVPGGRWVFTLHGPDGKDFPNESVFTAIEADRRIVIWHESGHQFELTVTLQERPAGTLLLWEQAFVDAAEAEAVRHIVEPANEQNLDRLKREVAPATTITAWIAALMSRELASFSRELDLFPDERLIWATAPGVSNSAGNLALHVAGNLQHFVGATLGDTGYVRNRDLEFSARDLPREAVQAELATAGRVVAAVLGSFPESRLQEIYPDILGGVRLPTGLFLQHLNNHLALHLGQVGYLRRMLTGSTESSNPVSMKVLEGGHI